MSERVTRSGTLAPEPAIALAHVLDTELTTETLPPLWHSIYLLDAPRQSDLGPDGHPVNGFPSPPAPGMRRMFAGGRVRTHEPLELGKPATRTTTVLGQSEKQGSSGKLLFVNVLHSYEQDGRVKVEAEDDIVYRPGLGPGAGAGTGASAQRAPEPEPREPEGTEELLALDADSRLLFRYSALTYNAHRIHYDRAWCALEGYSGLVIHGPLQVLLMAQALRLSGQTLLGREFSYRLVSPLVGEQRVAVRRAGPERVLVTGENGVTTAQATVGR